MKENAMRHFKATADMLLHSSSSATCMLMWRKQNTSLYDYRRDEYEEQDEMAYEYLNCLVYEISAAAIKYGNWGFAEVGDIIVGIDRNYPLTGLHNLMVVYKGIRYKVLPQSDVYKISRYEGAIGDTVLFRVLHCRMLGV